MFFGSFPDCSIVKEKNGTGRHGGSVTERHGRGGGERSIADSGVEKGKQNRKPIQRKKQKINKQSQTIEGGSKQRTNKGS